MEVLRLKISQNQANYRKPETINNKMTYPLPPLSTIIGAIHNACGFTKYRSMDISIQGKYESIGKKVYTDYCFLNSTQKDRGILVKHKDPTKLSKAFEIVAKAKKDQGNDFIKGITIEEVNKELLEEYRYLHKLKKVTEEKYKNETEPVIKELKGKEKELQRKLRNLEKSDEEIPILKEEITKTKKEWKLLEDNYKNFKKNKIDLPLVKFGTLTTSLKSYELLYGVKLIIHVSSDEKIMRDIEDNIYKLTAIGRSEDYVELEEVKRVTLNNNIEDEIISQYSSYIDVKLVKNKSVCARRGQGIEKGTTYYINKNYEIFNNKREFKKVKVMYLSNYYVDEESKGVFVDTDGYIVNLL